jgi:hypothetical protein
MRAVATVFQLDFRLKAELRTAGRFVEAALPKGRRLGGGWMQDFPRRTPTPGGTWLRHRGRLYIGTLCAVFRPSFPASQIHPATSNQHPATSNQHPASSIQQPEINTPSHRINAELRTQFPAFPPSKFFSLHLQTPPQNLLHEPVSAVGLVSKADPVKKPKNR